MTVEANNIEWLTHADCEAACQESRETNRPVLLDFHDPTCSGCERLEGSTYHTAAVVSAISEHAIPLRIVTTDPDKAVETILSRYIAISTPTVQLLSPEGTVYHCFRGAPRHTRLALSQWNRERNLRTDNYRRVHHEAPGYLPPPLFLAQFLIGRAKAAFKHERFEEAKQLFQKVLIDYANDDIAVSEARHWEPMVSVSSKALTRCAS